jgi:hypothetical protein
MHSKEAAVSYVTSRRSRSSYKCCCCRRCCRCLLLPAAIKVMLNDGDDNPDFIIAVRLC